MRKKNTFGPGLDKQIIIFIDDFNMPEVEEYGAQPCVEIIRQIVDGGGWFDLETKDFRHIVSSQVLSSMCVHQVEYGTKELINVVYDELVSLEPQNAFQFVNVTSTLSGLISVQQPELRHNLLRLTQHANRIYPIKEELANKLNLCGQKDKSMAFFESIVDEDETCITPIMNIIGMAIENRSFEAAETQLNLLNMLQDTVVTVFGFFEC